MVDDEALEELECRIVSVVFFVGGSVASLLALAVLEMGFQETGSLTGWIGIAFMVMGVLYMRPVRACIDRLNAGFWSLLGRGADA